MAFDFPSSPAPGALFTPTNGPTWRWDGSSWTQFEGAGSGLNADLLDGQSGAYYTNNANSTGLLPAASFDDTAHGNRAGGTLHAAVTTSVNGFMIAADKTKLDGVATGAGVAVPPATVAPLMDGVAAVGTTTKYAREDHKHPSDTAKLDVASATPPATVAPLMDGTAAVGSVAKYAKEDHIHPTDTSRAASAHTHSSIVNGAGTASVDASGYLTTSGGYFIGTATAAVLGTSGASGTVYLRPSGAGSTTNQVTIDYAGYTTLAATPTAGDSTLKAATTAFVTTAIAATPIKLIQAGTLTGANIDIILTSHIAAGYASFQLRWTGWKGTVDAIPSIRISQDGGSTFLTTNYGGQVLYAIGSAPSTAGAAAAPTTYIQLANNNTAVTGTSAGTCDFWPGTSTIPSEWVAQSKSVSTTFTILHSVGHGSGNINAIRLMNQAGNLNGGTYALYGYRTS